VCLISSPRSYSLKPRNQRETIRGAGTRLTPRLEAGELLEVGLGTVDREGRDDAPHFVLVGERTEDGCFKITPLV